MNENDIKQAIGELYLNSYSLGRQLLAEREKSKALTEEVELLRKSLEAVQKDESCRK